MRQLPFIVKLFVFLFLMESCIPLKVPMQYFMKDEITVDRNQIKDIAQDIFKEMADIKTDPDDPTIKEYCDKAFVAWLKKRFAEGLVPKRTILPWEYGKDSGFARISECNAYDVEREFKRSINTAAEQGELRNNGEIFPLDDLSKKLEEGGCVDNFTSEDQRKIELLGMNIQIFENRLNIPTMPYNLYVTTGKHPVDEEILEEIDAEEKLVESGAMVLFGTSATIKPKFEGTLPVELVENFDQMEEARMLIASLESKIIFMPPKFAAEPEERQIGDDTFFVVPEGSAKLKISLEFSLGFEFNDAVCLWDDVKNDIKDKEKARRDND